MQKKNTALLMLAASATLFGIMAFSAKLASASLSGAQVALVRFSIGVVPFLVIPSYRKAAWKFQRLDLLFYRGVFGGVAVLLYFLAIEHIPVGLATLLNYTAPLYSGLFAAIFIGESVRPRAIFPLAIAFAGVFLVVRAHASPDEAIGLGRWALLGLCSAILSGAAVTAIRVARRTESSWSIYASFTIFGWLVAAPLAFARWQNPTPQQWVYLVAVGLSSIGAQLLMTSALRWVDAVSAGAISQLAVIVSMLLGAVWLGEGLTTQGMLGSALTIGGVLAVMLVTSRPRPSGFDEAAEQ